MARRMKRDENGGPPQYGGGMKPGGPQARSIVLVGMPGSGKTTLGRMLAKALNKPYYDSDDAIREAEGMSIPEIFAQKGEAHFREVETRCLARLMAEKDAVVSVGGGAVLQNEELLRNAGIVLHVRRDIEKILETLQSAEPDARPLVRGAGDLERLYAQRKEIYERMSGAVIENNGPVEEALARALEAYYEIAGGERAEPEPAGRAGAGGLRDGDL